MISRSPRVLVVDDAPDLRAVVGRVLGSCGYRVDAVSTLAEARAMTPGEYDAVLVDMRLGSEQGTTLITELIAVDPRLANRCPLMSGRPPGPPGGGGRAGKAVPARSAARRRARAVRRRGADRRRRSRRRRRRSRPR